MFQKDFLIQISAGNFNQAFNIAELLICFWFETTKFRSPPE